MKALIARIFLLGIALPLLGDEPAATLRLRVFLYNYTGTAGTVVESACRETETIFWRAGVEMEWVQCKFNEWSIPPAVCAARRSAQNLELRLLPGRMADRVGLGSDALGFALQPADGVPGVLANVFPDRAADLSGAHGVDTGVLLGHLIAHELGHLLLGFDSHAVSGLMSSPWGKREIFSAMKGRLKFSLPETAKIRHSLAAAGASVLASSPEWANNDLIP